MGWIKIDRSIKDHWLWSDEKKLKWWLTILLDVNYSDRTMALGYNTYEIKRGQSPNSIRTWANIFKTGTKSVVRFLDMLERDGLITKDVIGNGKHSTTLITVCKYDSYDYDGNATETQVDTQETTQVDTQVDTQEGYIRRKKESKERKKGRSNPNAPTEKEVIEYVVGCGYSQSLAEKFYARYTVSGWVVKDGSPIENWKGLLHNAWFNKVQKSNVKAPALDPGWVYVDMNKAYGIVRETYNVKLSEKEKIGAGDDYVREMMNIHPAFESEGDGWKYRQSK
jgi:hypothetical protein